MQEIKNGIPKSVERIRNVRMMHSELYAGVSFEPLPSPCDNSKHSSNLLGDTLEIVHMNYEYFVCKTIYAWQIYASLNKYRR